MNKLKLMTIVGTRPELIRLSETIKKADIYFDHTFVHTGQNYDERLNDIFYDDLELRRPDVYLNAVGADLGETIGNIIAKSFAVMKEHKPDAMLILGDTNSALSAISAKRLKIPIFHMEAGNRCFDENLPEEINRRIVDHIADVNLPYTEHARKNLISEGIEKRYTFVTGSPMREVINRHSDRINQSTVLEQLEIEEKKYILLSAHREENIDNSDTFASLMNTINALAEKYKMPIIYSVHPRSAKFIKERNCKFHENVREMPPFSFTDFNKLMKCAFCVVSDSGTLPEEAGIQGFPAVSIRTSTERPEAIDKGVFIIGGIAENSALQAVDMAVKFSNISDYGSQVSDYKESAVSSAVVKLIQSYTGIVDKNTWGKQR